MSEESTANVRAEAAQHAHIATVRLPFAAPPVAAGIPPDACAAWSSRLGILAILSRDAVHLVRPHVSHAIGTNHAVDSESGARSNVDFGHGYVRAEHAFRGVPDVSLRRVLWLESAGHNADPPLLCLHAANGSFAALALVRAKPLLEDAWERFEIGGQQLQILDAVALDDGTLALLDPGTVTIYARGPNGLLHRARIDVPKSVYRLAKGGPTGLVAIGQCLAAVNVPRKVHIPIEIFPQAALQHGPVCGSYIACSNSVFQLMENNTARHIGDVPSEAPIAVIVDGEALIAVTIDGLAFVKQMNHDSFVQCDIGIARCFETSIPANSEQDVETPRMCTIPIVSGGDACCGLSAIILAQGRAIGADPGTVLYLVTFPGTETYEKTALSAFFAAMRGDQSALPHSHNAPIPTIDAPFGHCMSDKKMVIQTLHTCTMCNARFASRSAQCPICKIGIVLPF